MIGPKIIGPKCSIFCACISAWGIIMFLLLGAFFHVESPALREDISPSKFINQLIHFVVDRNDKFLSKIETRKDG